MLCRRCGTENRLTGISGGATASFVYDGDALRDRVKGTVNGVTTYYVSNHYELSGSTTRVYYYAGSTRVAMRENGTPYYLLSDHLGSTAVTANSGGGWNGEVRYKAFGETRYNAGGTPTTYRYTGQRQESALGGLDGLYFYGARWYDPSLGRFISADTIVPSPGNPQALNRYSYVNNNPLKYVDPSGHIGIPGVQGFIQLLQDTANNFASATHAYNAGERRPGVLALHATGGTKLLVNQAEAVNQLNQDTNVVFSQAPLEERLPHCVHLGVWATETAATVVGVGQLAKAGVGALQGQGAAAVASESEPQVGQKVYRVFGNRAKAYGRSWTPIDPRTVPDYADAAGLFPGNAGKYLSEGVLTDIKGINVMEALPAPGRTGGLTEYVIPDPKNQVGDIITSRLLKRLN